MKHIVAPSLTIRLANEFCTIEQIFHGGHASSC
jgi:hypothetical protein